MRYRVRSASTLVRNDAIIARGGDVVEFDLDIPSEAAWVRTQAHILVELGDEPSPTPDDETDVSMPPGQYADRAMKPGRRRRRAKR